MKIFYVGDSPTVDTGFGVVSKNLLTRWKKMGYEISVLGINEYADDPRPAKNFDFDIYPCEKGGPEQVYGMHKVWPLAQMLRPDIIFILNDPWLIKSYMDLKPEGILPYTKVVGYFPTDAAPLKPEWHKTLNSLDAQVCYTKYAEHTVIASNGSIPPNLHQIYHGVDTETFFPINTSYARQQLGLPTDLFIVGMVARNQPRKRFDLLMMAFAQFAKNKKNVKLYLHTGLHDVGFDILNLAHQLDISDKLILTEDITPNKGVEPQKLNYIYNSFNAHALISLGDGFCLPVAESMSVGCPQIVSGHSALQELVEGHGGYTVKTAAWLSNPGGINTWGGVSDVMDIVEKLEKLYNSPELCAKLGEDGYHFIKQEQFTWDYNAKEFDIIFKDIKHIMRMDNDYTNAKLTNAIPT